MNKTKILLAAVGGVALVVVLAAGYFAWSSIAARTAAAEGDDESDGLDRVTEKAERLLRKPVYPGAESVKALNEATEGVKAWKEEALTLASRGDRRVTPTTDAAFKEFIVGDAKRLRGLPAGKDEKTLSEAFDFGPFMPYIAEGKMPEQAKLRDLQRQWDDIVLIIETLSSCGVTNVSAIEVRSVEAKAKDEAEGAQAKAKNKAKNKAKAKDKKNLQPAAVSLQPSAFTYVVTCCARPTAFVKVLNAFATGERFTVVEDFTIRRERDTVGEGLGAVEKTVAAASATSSRRRRRGDDEGEKAQDSSEAKEAEPLTTVVTDPAAEPPFETKLTVRVCDFRTLEAPEEKKEGEVEK